MEHKLVPYQAIQYIPCSHALVFAPHPDDEVFGCGGAIMRHIERGTSVSVIVVSDGAYGVTEEKISEYIAQRQNECNAAAQILGYGIPNFWHYHDRQIDYGEKLIGEILAAIRDTQADLIYAPSVFEMHPDHRMLGMAVLEAVRRVGKTISIALYEIGIPLRPNRLLDISDLMARKVTAMECFVSQNALQRYDQHIAALNRYRTYTLPASVTAAEAYILLAAEELAVDSLNLYQSEHTRQRALGMALDSSSDIPLVSVIIRSIDRPTLSDALDSVALQAYTNIEVVIVNAKGINHRKMDNWCGRFPLRMVGTDEQSGRSRAANIGLQEAKGSYLIFLDDDDWFEADHIERLVQAIINNPDIKVVYSGTKCVDENNHPLPTQFITPYNSIQLIAGNYIPIHSALFSRELLDRGCAVDESLDLFEDWDFWLQASTFTDFLFIDRLSAAYRITRQSGFGVNADARKAEKASLIIFNKWLPRLQKDQLLQLMSTVRQNRMNEQQIKEQQQHIRNQEQQLRNLEEQSQNCEQLLKNQEAQLRNLGIHINNQEQQLKDQQLHIDHQCKQLSDHEKTLHEIFLSTSWQITGPLRWLGLKRKQFWSLWQKIQYTLKYHSNLRGLIKRIYAILQQEGVKPLLNKIIQFFNYQEWIRHYDTMNDKLRTAMRVHIQSFPYQPMISIVMPTYNSNPEWLIQSIESVRKQIYPHWELCIADDASTDTTTRPILERYKTQDTRIKVVYREENGHISAASNSALEIAHGEWIALLDHDDLLSEHALFWVVEALQKKSNVELIYSDEDKIDAKGNRLSPYFKCNWNKALFYSQNLISHLGVYRTSLVKKAGGFRVGFEGSQDYDLALRCTELISPEQIWHIPRILYHWRIHDSSTALSSNLKPYAVLAGEKALNDHFKRKKIDAHAVSTAFGYRIHYSLPESQPRVSLIIPTRNGLQLIRQCITSIIEKTTYQNYEILIIDNDSNDPATLRYLHQLTSEGRVRVIRDDRPFNFSALNNNAVHAASGELIGLLNNDLEIISPDWLSEMVAIALQPDVGAVGAKLLYPDNTLQHAGIILGLGADRVAGHAHYHFPKSRHGYFGRTHLISSFSAVSAACLVIKKSIYEQVGGLDEMNLPIAFNDVDFCLRVQDAGYHNIWTPYAELYHHESASRGYDNTPEKQARFAKETQYMKLRWGDLLFNDPAYNPNLTLEQEDFSLATPPRVETLSS